MFCLYVYSLFCLSVYLFICLLIDGCLDCFHLLTVENNAVMNIGVQISETLISITLDIYT